VSEMTEQEIQEIYNQLLALTKAQAIKWKKTGEFEFSVNFSRSSVTVEKEYKYDSFPVVLRIYNEDGLLVAYAAPEELQDRDSAVKSFVFDPSELFHLVENQVYKYEETSKNILDELKELGVHLRKTG
jgi:hypothetical protein